MEEQISSFIQVGETRNNSQSEDTVDRLLREAEIATLEAKPKEHQMTSPGK